MAWHSKRNHPLIGRSELEIAWLAGLLEGEGYFALKKTPGGRMSKYPTARVCLGMCDEDVVKTVAIWFDRACYCDKRQKPNWNPRYNTEILGLDAEHVMGRILPYMHTRRAAKINEILALCKTSRKEIGE